MLLMISKAEIDFGDDFCGVLTVAMKLCGGASMVEVGYLFVGGGGDICLLADLWRRNG